MVFPKNRWLNVCRSVFTLYRDFYRQQRLTKTWLSSIEGLSALPLKQKKRVYQAASVITASVPMSFAILRGNALNAREQEIQTLLAAMIPLYDDLFDADGFDPSEIWGLSIYPNRQHANPTARSYSSVVMRLREVLFDLDVFYEHFHRLHLAQIASLRQASKYQLPTQELLDVTYAKAGHSYVLSRVLMQNPLLEGEEEAIYRLGGVSQILDDIFDVWDDAHAQIDTIPLRLSLSDLAQRYTKECTQVLAHFKQFHLPEANVHLFLMRKAYILSIASVALSGYARGGTEHERKSILGEVIMRHQHQQFVCDMSRPGNVIRSILKTNSLYINTLNDCCQPRSIIPTWLD